MKMFEKMQKIPSFSVLSFCGYHYTYDQLSLYL